MKVAIAGFGVEGVVSCRYWLEQGAEVTIFDEKQPSNEIPDGVKLVIGEGVFGEMQGYDLVMRTPSLSPSKIKTDGRAWSATREFFEKCKVPIIGVTGTKGKGTTSSLIYEILKSAGKKVHLAGNIGKPMLEILPEITDDDAVVLELSSFQLWDLTQSPHIAVVLMIEPDHLNVHNDFEDYISAKANICKYQSSTDALYYHPTNEYSAQIATTSYARKYHYMTSEAAHTEGSNIVINGQIICSVSEVGLIGAHNLENICAAVSAAWEFTQDIPAIAKAIKNFKGLPHRLQFVAEKDGVKYYDDSYSSAAGATIAAIKSFNQPEILICGGYDRGLNYNDLAEAISNQKNIKKVILIGQTKNKIADHLTEAGFDKFEILDTTDFEQIVSRASEITEPGDVVLLSPGCASFDMFKNFEDRGQQFQAIVKGIK